MGGPGSGGHNKKPDNLLRLHGTRRKDRHSGKNTAVDVGPARQNPPRWLSKEAKKFWREHAPMCAEMGTLDALSEPLFTALCEHFATYRQVDEQIKADGMVLETAKGSQPHPLLTALNQTSRELMKLMAEFGLTPAGRKRLGIEAPAKREEDPFSQFLNDRSS